MSITVLTREMITEYEAMVGRQLTPAEYLQFREQAMRELQNGFKPTDKKQPVPVIHVPTTSEQKVATPVATQISASVMAKQEPMVQETSVSKPEVKSSEPKPKIEDDPFFALIDKMDA